MVRAVTRSEGFTLVEALVALVILAIVLLGLLAGLLTVYQYNLMNILRDEAGSVAQECIENIRSLPFAAVSAVDIGCDDPVQVAVSTPCLDTTGVNLVRRDIRNVETTYRVGWSVVDRGNIKEVDVRVCWSFRGRNYTYTFKTFVGR